MKRGCMIAIASCSRREAVVAAFGPALPPRAACTRRSPGAEQAEFEAPGAAGWRSGDAASRSSTRSSPCAAARAGEKGTYAACPRPSKLTRSWQPPSSRAWAVSQRRFAPSEHTSCPPVRLPRDLVTAPGWAGWPRRSDPAARRRRGRDRSGGGARNHGPVRTRLQQVAAGLRTRVPAPQGIRRSIASPPRHRSAQPGVTWRPAPTQPGSPKPRRTSP
jgi:hypothetical protein